MRQIWNPATEQFCKATPSRSESMGCFAVFLDVILLSSLCLTEAAREQYRTQLDMKASTISNSDLAQPLIVPSVVPSPSYAAPLQHDYPTAVAPAAPTAGTKPSITPLPIPLDLNMTCVGKAPSDCFIRPVFIGKEPTFGEVRVESNLFRRVCKRFCEYKSGRRCWLVKKPKIHTRCKQNPFLGNQYLPTCCFYFHCLRFRRPRGRTRMWWKHTSILRAVRGTCKS